MQGDMQTFRFFNFQMKRDLSLMQRTMKQKEIKQSALKVMRTERKQGSIKNSMMQKRNKTNTHENPQTMSSKKT
jgi:hypothetical protein